MTHMAQVFHFISDKENVTTAQLLKETGLEGHQLKGILYRLNHSGVIMKKGKGEDATLTVRPGASLERMSMTLQEKAGYKRQLLKMLSMGRKSTLELITEISLMGMFVIDLLCELEKEGEVVAFREGVMFTRYELANKK